MKEKSMEDYSVTATFTDLKWPFNPEEIQNPRFAKFTEKVFKQLDVFFAGQTSLACAISAPFRTGKTEFLFTCFCKTFNSKQLALYGTLEQYLKFAIQIGKINDIFDEKIEISRNYNLLDVLSTVISEQLKNIKYYFNGEEIENQNLILLPNFTMFKDAKKLKQKICENSKITSEEFEEIINNCEENKVVLLIDEMEENFEKLNQFFIGPLRSTLEAVNKDDAKFYVIFAFGMV